MSLWSPGWIIPSELLLLPPTYCTDMMFVFRLLHYAQDVGFYKAGEVTFPHKQSNLLKIRRETWEAPAL